jgi:glycosyltransferase involved in cell wall biosynthesis
MKVAYICEPQVGGTFVFFTQLRPQLARLGIDFRCIPPFDQSAFQNSRYRDMDGIDFLPLPIDPAAALGQIIRHLEEQDFRAVLVLPGCNALGTSLPAYLPAHIGCVAKIPHNGRGTYLPTKELGPYIDWIAPVNQLLADDLINRYGIPPEKVRVIYIGIDPEHFQFRERPASPARPCQLVVVGRLEDLQKNVLSLPAIVKAAVRHGVDVHCTVIGNGPDAARLESRIEEFGLHTRFTLTGALPYKEIPVRLREADIFLMPTRFEGCPHAMLEAMATGCIPVASRLHGTLDQIVEDGKSGFLIPLGDTDAFGRAIAHLASNPDLRRNMSIHARKAVLEKFTVGDMATAYADILNMAAQAPATFPAAQTLDQYAPPRCTLPSWRRWIPMPIKKIVRTFYARRGKSI